MFLNQLLNAIIQVLLFSLVPLLWWLVTARKKVAFFDWLGLRWPKNVNTRTLWGSIVLVMVVCFVIGEVAVWARGDVDAAESAYQGMGLGALPTVLVYAFLQTGLSEEILFRGFLLKRLMAKWGFVVANIVQALIFGALHLTMVWGQVGFLAGMVIVIYPMIPAVLMSILNEKKADGSILPSWLVHGTLNTVSALMVL
ncbi:MAG: CPBP family intramembrane metalloprotease [Peptococcaceae bacterium]|nr:CPBP family intramembrane metalloprotease [Peptococcaceae bacterium]